MQANNITQSIFSDYEFIPVGAVHPTALASNFDTLSFPGTA